MIDGFAAVRLAAVVHCEAKRVLTTLCASALLFGCATPGSLMNVKYPTRGNYAFQIDFSNPDDCNAMAARLDPFFRKQASTQVAAWIPFFAECTDISIANSLIYSGFAEIPGIAQPVRVYSSTRVLCEDAAAVLDITGLRSSGCRLHTTTPFTAGPLLQIKLLGLGTVIAELNLRTREDCLDLQTWNTQNHRQSQEEYVFWCVLEENETDGLAQNMVVKRTPDRFKEGHMRLRILDERRCRELERNQVLKAVGLEAIRGCAPVATTT